MVRLEDARQTLADEWRQKNPLSPSEIAAFYRDTQGLEDDLSAWHELPGRKAITTALVAAAQSVNAQRVLDVGAGMGQDLAAIDAAYKAAVEPNEVLRYRLNHAGIPTVASLEEVTASDFDLIFTVDVLEHVPNPDALLEEMIERLAPNGLLVERTSTYDTGTPLHLPELQGWTADPIMRRHGFSARWQFDSMVVWQRIGEKHIDQATILLCAYRSLSVETSECLTDLSWPVAIYRGDALISRVRSKAVSEWLRGTSEDVFLMIDDDIVFKPEDAAKVVDLARETKGIACGAYPVRDGGHLALRTLNPGGVVKFGPDHAPLEILWAATGFMACHRDVIEALIKTVPLCEWTGHEGFWPVFAPMILESDDGRGVYLSEDYAFCERARDLGFKVWLDPSVILGHIGQHFYSVYNMKTTEIHERNA